MIKNKLYLSFKDEKCYGFSETTFSHSSVFRPSGIDQCMEGLNYCRSKQMTICSRGSGYTYGDMILNDKNAIFDFRKMNNILRWDHSTGQITVEPGVTFADILLESLLADWTLPSIPGGMKVTVGGAISNNVHAKDSWKNGNFGKNVISMKILLSNGEMLVVNKEKNKNLFEAIIGGMGLLGIILEATLQLQRVPSPFVSVITLASKSIEETLDLIEAAKSDADFIIAWIDAFTTGKRLGRGYVSKAKWIESTKHVNRFTLGESLTMPTKIFGVIPSKPAWAVARPFFNPNVISIANSALYNMTKIKTKINKPNQNMLFTDYNFMHNKIPDLKHVYRPHGFLEFQPIIPKTAGTEAIREYFNLCHKFKCQSLLCGLKIHISDNNMISFAADGYSIPVDIQLKGRKLTDVKAFADSITNFILEKGGKIFLAKNEYLSRTAFHEMYPRYKEFMDIKLKLDPIGLFSSNMYRRLFL